MIKILTVNLRASILCGLAFAGVLESGCSLRPTRTVLPPVEDELRMVAVCIGEASLARISGTAFLVSSTGLMVTANHVVVDSQGQPYTQLFALRPTHPTTEAFEIQVVHQFKEEVSGRDLALLKPKLAHEPLPYFSVASGSVDEIRVGDSVRIIGFPKIFDHVFVWPLSRYGHVSSTRYKQGDANLVILDLTAVKGFSGSPVLNLRTGRVIGAMTGHPKDRPDTDFSISAVLTARDLEGFE